MKCIRPRLFVAVVAVAVLGFEDPARAADVCAETVPANRFIDGIPAYAQCAGSMNGPIYSDNGINTATMSGGTAWVRTQGSGGYQCTELAKRYLLFRYGLASVPNGNAGVWCDATLPPGLVKTVTPIHGDLIVLAPGSCGADATTGHVAVVDTVAADMTSVMAVQQNSASRSRYLKTCAACFLHATANDGTRPSDGGVPDAGTVDAGTTSDAGAPVDTKPADATAGSGGRGPGGGTATGGVSGSGGAPAAPAATGGAPGSGGTGAGTSSSDGGVGCAYVLSDGAKQPGGLLVFVAAFILIGRRRRR